MPKMKSNKGAHKSFKKKAISLLPKVEKGKEI
jgi:ribosomal protein L35